MAKSPNPSGLPGANEFDGKLHKTYFGKIVYDRKSHPFTKNDVIRILKKIRLTPNDLRDIINLGVAERDDLEILQDALIDILVDVLDSVLPGWVGEVVRWIYENVDAGIPPWIPEDLR